MGILDWFMDPVTWAGNDGLPNRLLEHSLLTVTATAMAMALGLPIAVWLGHIGKGGTLAVNLAGVGRSVPIIAMLSLLALGWIGSGHFGPYGRAGLATLITLALFAVPPIITTTYTAMRGVDRDMIEAAKGMGMSGIQVLIRVELPSAIPLIVSAVRLALVQVWATATVAALVAGPGLGRIIIHGYDSYNPDEVYGAALVVAAIALLLDGGMSMVQKSVTPPGSRAASN